MPICVVQGCHYRRGQKSRKQLKFERETGQLVTLHRFPKDPARRHVWMEALTGWVDRSNDNSFICSTHFTDDSWEKSSVNRRLKADALPTLFPQGVDVSPVARKRRRIQVKEEVLDVEIPIQNEEPPHCQPEISTQEPEVLLTELHRADPIIPTVPYTTTYDTCTGYPTDVAHY